MQTVLAMALTESCGYLEDQGWHQTAQLMALAAGEIEQLTERVHELETGRGGLRPFPPAEKDLRMTDRPARA